MNKIHHNSEKLFIQGDGKQVRDFNHVANVVEAFFTIAERGELRGEAYNIASDETTTVRELAEMICGRMQVNPRFVFDGEARAGDMRRLHADISRLKSLDYKPRVNFADGLDATIRWFQEEEVKAMSVVV
jgi:nucleoside-diphosphate-sugar epimerase